MDLSPDKAAIVGGVSSSGLKPTDVAEQLDKQLALIKTYVNEKHGELQLLERVRTLKNPPPPGREDPEPPFQIVQRMQATFPPDAPLDAILQKLIELGMDRFGDNVANVNTSNRREAVVRFRFSSFDAKMNDFQQRCAADAWKQWCAKESTVCPSQTPPADLDIQTFNVRSKESLMRPEGGNFPLQFTMGKMQHSPDPPDLLGNITVHLEGNIQFQYHAPEAAKP
jgi:hypothetical protein